MNTKKTILIIVVFLTFISALPVAAVNIPTIAGISKDATAAEFIVYFFNLLVVVGSFIAIVMTIMAGIEWMTADGNPSKVDGAKDKIKNTLLGVAVLIGCYILLDTINPQLKTIKIDNLICTQGIGVMPKATSSTDKPKQKCITDTTSNIGYDIETTLDWDFPADTLSAVYTYPEKDFGGTPTEISCANGGCSGKSGEIKGAKSIYFLWKSPGLYLYDLPNFQSGPGKKPIFLPSSIKKLTDKEFNKTASSIKIVDPDPTKENVKYQAIVFAGPNHTGACSFLAESSPDLSVPIGGSYPTPIGNKELSSVIITKFSMDQIANSSRGFVTLYNKIDCAEPTASSSGDVQRCVIRAYGQQDISKCGDNFGSVKSFSITGPLGLALISKNGNINECRYYDINTMKEGVCQSSLPTAIDDPTGIRVTSVIMLPVDKR